MTTTKLISYIRDHGHQCRGIDGDTIEALTVWTRRTETGAIVTGETWITLPLDFQTVRIWLGY